MLQITEKDRKWAEKAYCYDTATYNFAINHTLNTIKDTLQAGLALAEYSRVYRYSTISSCAQYNHFYRRAKNLGAGAYPELLDDFCTKMMLINKKPPLSPYED